MVKLLPLNLKYYLYLKIPSEEAKKEIYFEILFKNFDPFQESLDTPTQIGTAAIFTKSFAHMMDNNGYYKILNFNGQASGVINIQISSCDKNGNILETKAGFVKNPEKELLNKQISFILKINSISGIDKSFEVCSFAITISSSNYLFVVFAHFLLVPPNLAFTLD